MAATGRPAAGVLRAERLLRERVEALSLRLRESIDELHVEPANVERVVTTALRLARQPALRPVSDDDGLFQLPVFHGTWKRAADGLEDPLSHEPRPVTFDRARMADREDVVLAHLGHPLVAMSTRLLRAAVWGAEHGGLHRVAACVSSDPVLESPVLAAFSRLVLVGADGARLHEEVFATAGWLRDDRFERLGVQRTRAILDATFAAGEIRRAGHAAQLDLAARWAALEQSLDAAIRARADERVRQLLGRLSTLREREIANLEDTIGQFRRTLQRALVNPEYEQLQLVLSDADERAQLRRDVDTWRATLEGLDGQLAEERDQIERRYAEIRPLTFPAAILFVLPA